MAVRQTLMNIGIVILVIALLWPYLGKVWFFFHRLPGNIYIKRDGMEFYFPLTTCLVISAVWAMITWLTRRF